MGSSAADKRRSRALRFRQRGPTAVGVRPPQPRLDQDSESAARAGNHKSDSFDRRLQSLCIEVRVALEAEQTRRSHTGTRDPRVGRALGDIYCAMDSELESLALRAGLNVLYSTTFCLKKLLTQKASKSKVLRNSWPLYQPRPRQLSPVCLHLHHGIRPSKYAR